MDMSVVEIVDVILVLHCWMAAPLVMNMRVAVDREVVLSLRRRSCSVVHVATLAEVGTSSIPAAGGCRWRTLGPRRRDEHDGRAWYRSCPEETHGQDGE
jgi:hypothetical protein